MRRPRTPNTIRDTPGRLLLGFCLLVLLVGIASWRWRLQREVIETHREVVLPDRD